MPSAAIVLVEHADDNPQGNEPGSELQYCSFYFIIPE